MPHKGAGGLKTGRHIALAKGTDASGFTAYVDYCHVCGHEVGGDMPHGHYDEQEPAVKEGSAPPRQPQPMKLGGK
jgi:hypothetical protein